MGGGEGEGEGERGVVKAPLFFCFVPTKGDRWIGGRPPTYLLDYSHRASKRHSEILIILSYVG